MAERLSQLWVNGWLIAESNPRAAALAVAGARMPLCRWQAGADHPLWTKPVGSRPGSQATPGCNALAPCPSYPTLQPPISRSVSDSPSPSSIERMVSSRCQAGSTSKAALLGQVVNPRVCARGHPMDLAEVRVGGLGEWEIFRDLTQPKRHG